MSTKRLKMEFLGSLDIPPMGMGVDDPHVGQIGFLIVAIKIGRALEALVVTEDIDF